MKKTNSLNRTLQLFAVITLMSIFNLHAQKDSYAWDMTMTRPLSGGNTQGIACGNLTFAEKDITIELWLNITTAKFINSASILSSRQDGIYGFSLDISSDGRLRGFFRNDNGDKLIGRTDYVFPFFFEKADIVDKWVHIAIVFSSTNNIARSYLNGEVYQDLVKSKDPYVPYKIGWIGNIKPDGTNVGDLRLGYWYATAANLLYAKIADVRIWSVGRTDAEIKANYNKNLEGSYVNNPGLYLNYRFFTYERGFINDANPTVATNKGWCNPSTAWDTYYKRETLSAYPRNLAITDGKLTWDTIAGAWEVNVYKADDNTLAYTNTFTTNSVTLKTITELAQGTNYYVKVRNKNTNFYSGWSGVLNFTFSTKSIALSAGTGGTISSGAGIYYTGTSAIVVANVEPGYHFVNWTLDTSEGLEQSQSATYTFTVSSDKTLVANFASNTVSLSNGTTNATDLPNCSDCDVTISGSGTELTIDQNMILNSLVVSPGNKLTLNDGKTLAVGTLTLQSTTSGNATFVDKNTAENPPTILATVQQYLPETNRNWYVSSPIISATNGNLSTGSGVVEYNEEYGTWPNVSGSLNVMKGYISTNGSAGTGTISFSGNLNNGTKSITLSCKGKAKTGFNLVGNPYPSYLMWTESLATSANCLSTIWYRTKSNGLYSFPTYNAPSGVGVPSSTTGYIPPMQAFWVRTTVDGSVLSVDNTMRSHGNGASNVLKAPTLNKNLKQLVRLQVSDASSSDETVIYFHPNADDTYDTYDSPKMSNNNSAIPEIYTTAGTEQLVINGMNSIPENTEIPIGFKSGNSTSYTIKAIEVTNVQSSVQILLKDNATGNIQDLSDGSTYYFDNSAPSTGRFFLTFKSPAITTATNSNLSENLGITIFRNNSNQVVVNCNQITDNTIVSIYSIVGHKLIEIPLYKNITVFDGQVSSGIYLVKVQNGEISKTKKVILK